MLKHRKQYPAAADVAGRGTRLGRNLFLAVLLLAPSMAVPAEIEHWRAQARDGELEFSAWYDGQELTGQFTRFIVDADVQEGAPISLNVRVETGSADMKDDEVNSELAQPEWFDVAPYPVSTFQSSDIRTGESGYLATGKLRIKEIMRTLQLPFTWRLHGDDADLVGTVRLDRDDWQLGSGKWEDDTSLAEQVEVRYHVTLHRED